MNFCRREQLPTTSMLCYACVLAMVALLPANALAVTIVNASTLPLDVDAQAPDLPPLAGDPLFYDSCCGGAISFDFEAANTSNSYLALAIYTDNDTAVIADVQFNGVPVTFAHQGRAGYAYGPVTDGTVTVDISTEVVETFFPGDYNGDMVTDAADYTVWRDNLNANVGTINGEVGNPMTPGVMDQEDYDHWRANFGSTGVDVFAPAPWAVVAYQVNDTSGVNATALAYDPANGVMPDPTDTQITTTETAAVLSVLFNDRTNQNASVFAGDEFIAPGDQVEQAYIQPQFVSTNIGTIGEVGGVAAGTYNLFWDFSGTNQRRVGQVGLAFAALGAEAELGSGAAGVPEPSTIFMLIAAALGLVTMRKCIVC